MADEQAELLRALHDAYAPALFRYVIRLTRDYGFAQDVVQEALLRAWRRPAILEQNAEAALSIAHTGYLLLKGQLVASGTASELLANDVVKHLYL